MLVKLQMWFCWSGMGPEATHSESLGDVCFWPLAVTWCEHLALHAQQLAGLAGVWSHGSVGVTLRALSVCSVGQEASHYPRVGDGGDSVKSSGKEELG